MDKDRYDPSEPDWHREFRRSAIRAEMKRKAEAGGTPGCAPIGYRNRRDQDGHAYIEIDPVQGKLVREAFELMATGEYSLRKLLTVMTEKGMRSRNGKLMSVSAFWEVLTNPFYLGLAYFRDEIRPAEHLPLTNQTVFGNVQRYMAGRRRRHYTSVP